MKKKICSKYRQTEVHNRAIELLYNVNNRVTIKKENEYEIIITESHKGKSGFVDKKGNLFSVMN